MDVTVATSSAPRAHEESPHSSNNNSDSVRRVVFVSRVLWEQVVVPLVLAPARRAIRWGEAMPDAATGCMFRVAEAAFPLVALCCRAVGEANSAACVSRWAARGHYATIEDAAAAPSPRCVAWLISKYAAAAPAGPSPSWSPSRCGPLLRQEQGGGGGNTGRGDGVQEGEGEGQGQGVWRGVRERRKAREKIAFVGGLCRGGHLDLADRFVVENGWEDPALWRGDKRSAEERRGSANRGGAAVPAPGTVLYDEFWSKKGLSHIMKGMCVTGNLAAVKWILSRLIHVTEGNKTIMQEYLSFAAYYGQLHILRWLVDTFDLRDGSNGVPGGPFHVRNRASDLREYVESFPCWNLCGNPKLLACTTATCKSSPPNEIIEVCQWWKDKFSLEGEDFGMPKHLEVLKWALTDVTDPSVLDDYWNYSCDMLGNVELGEWFIEEKGITPTVTDFDVACQGTHDNVAFVEWLSKKVSPSVSDFLDALCNALCSRNDLISRWLEKYIITTTNARPSFSLSSLGVCITIKSDPAGWLEWLSTHSDHCDFDCSTSEVASFVQKCVWPLDPIKFSVAVVAWKKFSLCPVIHHDVLVSLLSWIVRQGTFHQFKEAVSLGEVTPVECEQLLYQCSNSAAPSGKVVKWLCSRALLNSSDDPTSISRVLPSIHAIFVGLLASNKRACVEWIFNMFRIALQNVIVANQNRTNPLGGNVDVATWKLMLRLFPDLYKDVALNHFLGVVSASQQHTQLTIDKLGVTQDEILFLCSTT